LRPKNKRPSDECIVNEFLDIFSNTPTWGSAEHEFLLLPAVFGLASIGFLIAFCRLRSTSPTVAVAPTGLCFDSKLRVESDGSGGKKVSVIVRNHSPQTMGSVVVTLDTLEALTAKRFADAHRKLEARVQLLTEDVGETPDGPLVLEPGKSAAFVVAQSKVGEGFFCVPFSHPENNRHEVFKVSLAPYVATVTAGAANAETTTVHIEIPVAGRGIGQAKVRRQNRDDHDTRSCAAMPA
jgi:hypothetical protein